MIWVLINMTLCLILALFCALLTWIYSWRKKLIYKIFREQINFQKFPLFLRNEEFKLLIFNVFCIWIILMLNFLVVFLVIKWLDFQDKENVQFLWIIVLEPTINISLILGIYWKAKMSMKNQTSYANNDPELKNKWDQENFFIKIDKNLIKEINLIQSTILIRYFQKRLKVKLKKYEQKNAKMQNLHKPDKQIESFLCYLRIYAVFINFMGWNSINTIYINQKEVNIDQMKQAIIENFFYFKNYNSEKKII